MRHESQGGSATLELVVLTPAVLALVALVVLAGRITSARQVVTEAAEDAVRAASLARSAPDAYAMADAAAQADLVGRHCDSWTVTLTGDVVPGSSLSARVTCTTSLGILPGGLTESGTASQVVDVFRGVSR